MVHYKALRRPRCPGEEYADLYLNEDVQEPALLDDVHNNCAAAAETAER